MIQPLLKCLVGLSLIKGLDGCVAPEQSPPFVYPQNRTVSTPQGIPCDSATNYFPTEAALNPKRVKPRDKNPEVLDERSLDCQFNFEFASQCLYAFKAPVLSNYFLGNSIYRFVWLRSFHRPALLTLRCTATGGTLQTQFLNKEPGMTVPGIVDPDEPGISSVEHQRRVKYKQRVLADSEYQASIAFAKLPVVVEDESTTSVSPMQVQRFQQMLAQANFSKMPSCEPKLEFDGAYWLLEAHEPGSYSVVGRQSPDKEYSSRFRRCCDFLLDLSAAKMEERY
ncbi:hypothetical protein MUN81_07880 [Hymenobacter sp. 5317J-9]|uniref:hypothetical protein n=1 Tax=Hymenobacter sp. 5317J-9 TaxID=2932250 RepID=UPI001FD63778|nr:hypothetical protein [Hymenobacter sp. 5317J-9]UOQ99407.1 hypothetical protein MUN81_07880 [Hymenobacter sp. 5317J-9]